MNDDDEPQVLLHIEKLVSPSDTNTVFIAFETKYEEILRDPTTGHQTQTGRSVRVSPSLCISFSLLSSSPQYIQSLVSTQLVSFPDWLCDLLASEISTDATNLGFGFNLTLTVTVAYQTLVLPCPSSSNDEGSLRAIEDGSTRDDERKGIEEFEDGNRVVFDLSVLRISPVRSLHA